MVHFGLFCGPRRPFTQPRDSANPALFCKLSIDVGTPILKVLGDPLEAKRVHVPHADASHTSEFLFIGMTNGNVEQYSMNFGTFSSSNRYEGCQAPSRYPSQTGEPCSRQAYCNRCSDEMP